LKRETVDTFPPIAQLEERSIVIAKHVSICLGRPFDPGSGDRFLRSLLASSNHDLPSPSMVEAVSDMRHIDACIGLVFSVQQLFNTSSIYICAYCVSRGCVYRSNARLHAAVSIKRHIQIVER
jgi:hypothetical protein